MKGVIVEGVHHWGFSIRVPKASAGGSSYPYVPISTILGALSRGYCTKYAMKNGVSCTDEFIKAYKDYIFWVAYGAEEPRLVTYSDMLREERIPYRQAKYRTAENVKEWFGVSAFGKTYGEFVKFSIAIIVSEKVEEMLKYAWQITSLGSKESLVTITDVKATDVNEADVEEFYTPFFIPAFCASDLDEFEQYQLPVLNVYKLSGAPVEGVVDNFLIPVRGPLIGGSSRVSRSNLSGECKVFKLGEKYIVTPKEGLKKWLK